MQFGMTVFSTLNNRMKNRQKGRTSGKKNCRDADDVSITRFALAVSFSGTLMSR